MRFQADLHLTLGAFQLHAEADFPLTGIAALFGQSGSGKTTLLRCIAGLDRGAGSLCIGAQIWQDEKVFLPPHRRRVGYIFQTTELFTHLNVEQNLLYGYRRLHKNERRFEPEQVIELLRIRHLLPRHVAALSGGERQLVALGRTLLRSPDLMLMDEPLAALDQSAKLLLFPFLRRIASDLRIPVIYVSHSIDEVARLADSLILIDQGRIVATGEIRTMLTRLDLPLAHSEGAESLIMGTVSGHDEDYQLTRVQFSGGEFTIPRVANGEGSAVRLRIVASDVSLSLTRPADSSILNVFPAQVVEITPEPPALMLVKLDLGDTMILARVTRLSCDTLGLTAGAQVFAQVKSAAALA